MSIAVRLSHINRERVVMVVGLFCTWRKGVSICVNRCERVVNMLQMLWTCCRDRKFFISTTSSQQVHDSYVFVVDLL